jgi:uncharacterized membrane protein YfcA
MGSANCKYDPSLRRTPGPAGPTSSMEILTMRETRVTMPELALIAGTRGMLGAGIGLLVADRLPEAQRKAVGWTLLLIGALTTIPLALEVLGADRSADGAGWVEPSRDFSPAYAG